jgi:Fur family iron response transcriptional regulator
MGEVMKTVEEQTASLPGLEQLGPIAERLRAVGIPVTLQRLAIGQVLLAEPVHLTADQVLARVRCIMPEISRATVYNTLKLFSEKGLLRELVVEPDRIVFDSNTAPHYHLYDVETGAVTDVPASDIEVIGAANLPAGFELETVDVILRVRKRAP